MREGETSTSILAEDFTHYAFSIGAAFAHVARRGNEAKIAETVFKGAQSAVSTAIKIDFAGIGIDTDVCQMSLESNQRRPLWFRSILSLSHATGQGPRSSRGVDRYGRMVV